MANLENYEKIERVLFQAGNFSIKNTILLGQKSATTGSRLDPIYNKTYASTKYTNRSQLSQMTIRTSDFLVFSYNNFDSVSKENKGIDIYTSYPHILDVIDFFKELNTIGSTNGVYTKTGVSPQYSEILLESQELGGGKRLRAIPSMLEDKDSHLRPGFILFFNDEDKYIDLDLKGVFTILYILDKIDLLTLSNQTLLMGMINDIGAVSGAAESNNSFETTGRTSIFNNKNRRSTFSGRSVVSPTKVEKPSQTDGEMESEPTQSEQSTSRTVPQSNQARRGISMADVQKTAEEIDISDVEEIDV